MPTIRAWIGRILLYLPHGHSVIDLPERGQVMMCHQFRRLILTTYFFGKDGSFQHLTKEQFLDLMDLRAELVGESHEHGKVPMDWARPYRGRDQ